MASTRCSLRFDECPKTRKGFLAKWREDRIFRQRAEITGFRVIGENVILPNGMIADKNVG